MTAWLALMLGFVAAVLLAFGAFKAEALSGSGAIAAIVVGTAIFGLGGLRWAAVMVVFFVASSLLSRLGRTMKKSADAFTNKGSRRDAIQVLANGGAAAAIAILHGADHQIAVLFPAFLGSMAAATADTWSTEIGALSPVAPRFILSGKEVLRGTSGGVTALGLAGALAGAAVIGVTGGVANTATVTLILVASIAGVGGSVVDSLLGASVQRVNRCPLCLVMTERRIHDCGTATVHARGWSVIDNDIVNAITTVFGAVIGALLFSFVL